MAEIVDFNITFTDNSSGVRAEKGTEVQIYTDSPSFVPNVLVDHAFAPHAWMSLPLVGPGITTIPLALETPVTFVRVRIRQYNDNGNGTWNSPGGGVGELFLFTPTSAADAPDAPSNVGLIVVATPTDPVDPPIDPPIEPEPPGSTSNYTMPGQFSGTQGSSGWRYKTSAGDLLVYDAASVVWRHSPEAYLTAWGGLHPGPTLGAQYEWTVPNTGTVVVTGNVNLYAVPSSGNGATYVVKHNATTKFTQSMTDTTVYQLASQIVSSFAVTAGDVLTFTLSSNQVNNSNLSAQTTINIALTSGGSPTNPVVSNITPGTLEAHTGTVTGVVVNLSSPALVNSTISLASTNGGIASVLASIVIPTGQQSGAFNITAVSAGTATITATYNGSSAQCVATVTTPPAGGQWPNEPAGMTVETDSPFSDSLGAEWANVYNTAAYASPGLGGQSFSPPRVFDTYKSANSYYGSGQWELHFTASREIYVGLYWGTNSGFQGYSNNTNKMFFVRNPNFDNSFICWQGLPDTAKVLKWYQQGQYNNTHIPTVFNTNYPTDGTGWFENNINQGAATYTAGQPMRFIELYLKSSTTSTSQDGIIKWWVNGTLCGSYTNANITPAGFIEAQLNHAWDGSVDPTIDLSRSWHHYWDHIRLTRKT